MDFTVIIVGLLIGVGIPLRNKAIKQYRKKGTKTSEPAFLGNLDIVTINGEEQNFKITTKNDLMRFEEIVYKGRFC